MHNSKDFRFAQRPGGETKRNETFLRGGIWVTGAQRAASGDGACDDSTKAIQPHEITAAASRAGPVSRIRWYYSITFKL